MTEKYISNSALETFQIGFNLGSKIKKGNIVTLKGELGSGKTLIINGICKYFKIDDIVTSPTFSIYNQYFGVIEKEEVIIFHIDLYRIKNINELNEIGFDEVIQNDSLIKFIEWPDKAKNYLSKIDIEILIKIDNQDENKREIIINFS